MFYVVLENLIDTFTVSNIQVMQVGDMLSISMGRMVGTYILVHDFISTYIDMHMYRFMNKTHTNLVLNIVLLKLIMYFKSIINYFQVLLCRV